MDPNFMGHVSPAHVHFLSYQLVLQLVSTLVAPPTSAILVKASLGVTRTFAESFELQQQFLDSGGVHALLSLVLHARPDSGMDSSMLALQHTSAEIPAAAAAALGVLTHSELPNVHLQRVGVLFVCSAWSHLPLSVRQDFNWGAFICDPIGTPGTSSLTGCRKLS